MFTCSKSASNAANASFELLRPQTGFFRKRRAALTFEVIAQIIFSADRRILRAY